MPRPPGVAKVRRAFAKTLRELRHRAGLSQEGLAHAAHIDRVYMSALERAVHNPSLELITRLVIPLGITPAEFVAEFQEKLIADRAPSRRG